MLATVFSLTIASPLASSSILFSAEVVTIFKHVVSRLEAS